jgi:hypothetical protein
LIVSQKYLIIGASLLEEEKGMYDEMGMTDNQWKDRLRVQRDELLRLKGLVDESNKEFHKEADIILKRIQESLES